MRLIPDPLVRLFARPYVAGDSVQAGLAVARELWSAARLTSSLDLLAEEISSRERIEANRRAYRELVEAIAADPAFAAVHGRPTVSVKLSSFTASPLDKGGDASGSHEAMEDLAKLARARGVALTIDMENHTWTDFTLRIALDLYRRGFDVGTVLQTRLHRTASDLSAVPAGMRLRLVIGIYVEPPEIALTDKAQMKERMLEQAASLLDRGVFVEFATHDESCLRRFFETVVGPRDLSGSRYEVQMIYGVPRADLLRQIQRGELTPGQDPPRARLYVPFATTWDQATAYCRRRLADNPGIALYVARNALGMLRGRRPGLAQYLATSEVRTHAAGAR